MSKKKVLCPENFYDRMAPFYDRHIEQTRLPLLSLTEEREFLESFLKERKRILDLGCGTGRTIKLLVNKNRTIVGIDISNEMIRIAKAAGLKVIQASCYELPFNNAYFDAAYSIHMGFGFCRSMYDMKMLSKELFRVLAKQGIILLDTPHAKTKGKEYLTSWMAKDELVSAMSYGKTKEEIMEVLTDAGFVDISFYGFYNFGSQLHDDSRRIIVVAEKP